MAVELLRVAASGERPADHRDAEPRTNLAIHARASPVSIGGVAPIPNGELRAIVGKDR
jgi:hypothetical protein